MMSSSSKGWKGFCSSDEDSRGKNEEVGLEFHILKVLRYSGDP